MADTDTETLPNGTGALSEEDERLKQRPADIDADVREMERRKRVEALMSSKLFREELERVLDQQLHEGGDAPLLQRIREMVGGRLHTGSLRGPSCVLPINDIRGIEGVGYEKGEKILRCKLAAVYRLVDLFGWTQTGMSGQITARLNTAVEQVLTTPRGLLPHEVTASSLVKVDMQGNVQDQGTTNFPPNVEGFSIHGAVHAARPDVRCVLHVRSSSALAVSCMKRGLLPLCDEACVLGEVAYHPLPYGKLDNEEQEKLVRALGPHAKVLILYSNGALCCGATLEEAFFQAKNLTAACDVQLRLASLPLPELQLIDEDTKKHIYEASRKPPADEKKWRVGGEEFEALMRMLDNAGFRTGYIYRHPLIKNEVPKPRNDVEVPPAVSSLGYLFEEEELYRQGLWKKGTGTRGERTRWLNSPNVYQKVEVLETGTNDPRKITKWVDANNDEWVQDGSPGHSSTPVKIDTLQFVPKNTNPKEFKALQQQIKDNRRADKISAGPQSHILEGVTWDEAAKLVGEDAHNTHTGDAVVLMGAASKGIIQRGYQHNATVYSAPYARNPFDHISDREIQEYRRIVERKQRPDYDTDVSESEAISAAQLTSPASEDESRDEHRVLRIETKQVPVRSQPEVVLSDDTTDFLHAERAHADRTKDYQRDPNLLSDDEVFFDTPVSPLTSSVASPEPEIKFLEKSKRSQPIVVVRTQTRNDVVLRTDVVKTNITPTQQRVLTGTLTSDRGTLTEALNSNKRTLHDFPRNTNLQNAIKKFDEIPTHSLKHPKCKISLNSKLPSDLRIELKEKLSDLNSLGGAKMTNAFDLTSKMTDVRSDALDVYNGNASSRSSLNSIPSIEWDARCRWEHNLRTRSLPRKLKNTTNRFYRTQSHCGFVNFNKEPEPVHFHLPRCRSCGTTNSSYAWELTKEEKGRHASSSLYCSGDNLHQKFIDEAKHTGTIVKVTEKVVPVFKVAKPDDSDSEFVESQEFTEDNYIGDIGNSFSSANQTVVEKDQSNSQDLTMTQARVQDNAKGGKIEGSSATDSSNSDTFRAELVNITAGIEDINNNVDNAAAGEYHSFTEEMDFEEAVYESPVKDLVEKDIRDYSVPIDFYYADYKNRSSGMSPAKRVDPKPGTLEPILEESKSSYDDSGNLSNDKSNLKDDLEQSSKDMAIEEHEDKRVLLVQELKKNSEDMKQKVEDKMVSDDFGILYPQKSIENNIDTLLISENCIAKKEVNHYSNESIEAEHLIDKSSYIINGEDESEYTTNDLSSVTNAVQTAMEIYTTLDEEIEVDTADIAECVYENIFEMLSIDAIATEVRSSSVEYSVASSSELKSFNSTVEFEKHEVIAEIVTEMLNKICASNDNRKVFVDLPKPKIGSHSDMYEAGFVTAVEVSVKETELTKNNTSLDSGSDNTNNNNVELIYEGKAVINELSESKCGLIEQCSLNFTSYSSTKDSSVQLTSENSSVTDSSGELMSDTASHASPEEFSLAKIIEDIELNFTGKLSETSLAESSDSEISHTYKIVEGLLYYIFNEAFAVSNKRSRSEKTKVVKSVVTVVDPEDILFTTSAAILNDNIFIEADANQCIVLEDVVAEDQDELTNNKHDIKECKSNTNKSVINRKIDNVATISESKYDKTPIYSQIKRDTPELKIDSRLTLLEESAQLNGNNKPETNSVCKGISGLQKQSEVTHNESELKVEIKSISQAFGEFVVLDDNQNTGSETISDEQKKSEKAYEFRKSCIDAEHKIISEENMCPEFNTSKNSFANVKDRKSHLSSVVTENLNHVEAVEMCSDNVFVMRLDNYVTLNTDENIAKHDNPSLRELINEDHEITTNVKNTQELQTCKSDDYQQYLNDKIVPLADTDKNHKPISNADISYRMHEECLETTVFNMEDIVNMSNNEQTLALSQEIRNYGNVYAEQEYLEDKALTNKETYNLEQISNKIGVEAQKDFVHDADVSVLPEASFLASDDFNIGRQSVDNLSDADNSLTPDLSVLGVEAQIESVYNKRIQLDISILPETSSFESTMGSDDFNAATQSVDAISGADNSVTPNISVLNNSEMSTDTVKTDATYVIKKDMNTAFLEASSPKRETPVFEACSESPIKNTSGNFAEDVSLYGKDDTILGSPFVKQTVISMSQSAHSGGIKYWLSFDENLTDEAQQKSFKSVRRSKGSEFPSFVTLDCHNKRNKRQEFVLTNDYERKPERRSSVLDLQQSEDRTFLMAGSNQLEQSDFNLKDDIYVNKRRGGVLFDDSDQSKESDLKIEDSFASCTSTDYVTCESDQKVKQEFQNPDVPKKKLIYDTRVDLHTKPGRRYASWPPFEDTLFYRIISQFRMSESFDPSDFENLTFDDSAL